MNILFHIQKQRFHQLFTPEAEKKLRELADFSGPYEDDSNPIPPLEDLKKADIAFISHRTQLDANILNNASRLRWIHEGTGHPPQVAYKEAYEKGLVIMPIERPTGR